MAKPELLIISLLLFGVGAYMFYRWYYLQKKIKAMIDTPTSKCSTLENGAGRKGEQVEVKGVISPGEDTLLAPYSKLECAYYHSTEKEKIREVYYSSSGRGGGRRKRSRIVYNTIADIKASNEFIINDGTGTIRVDPEGAEIEGRVVINTLTPVGSGGTGGGFFGSMFEPTGRRIIGRLKREEILPTDQNCYLIGTYYIGRNGPFIGCDPEKKCQFVISLKSEEEIIAKGKQHMFAFALGWVTFFITALYACITSFISNV